jgi:hypothetical protein
MCRAPKHPSSFSCLLIKKGKVGREGERQRGGKKENIVLREKKEHFILFYLFIVAL